MKKPYRHKVKESLKKRLLDIGFTQYGESHFEKHGHRWSKSVNLHDTYFAVDFREVPAKEGWYRYKKPYTYDNVKKVTPLG